MSAIRVGVLGAGAMGANHARVVAEHPGAELAVVVDPNGDAATSVAGRYGVAWATSGEALDGCTAVVVAAPTEHHVAVARPLLAAGVPLLVEKPLATDSAGVTELLAAARLAGTPMMCGFVERFNAAVVTALGRLTEPPVSIQAVRHSPAAPRITTSVVTDLLIHDIDLVARATGERAPSAVTGVLSGPAPTDDRATPVAEQADVLLGWDDGPVANLSASRMGQRKVRTLSLVSGTELVEVDLLRQNVTVYRHVRHELVAGSYRSDTIVDIPFVRHAGEPLALQFEHFLGLVAGRHDAEAELCSLVVPHQVADAVEAGAVRVTVPIG